MTLLLAWVGCGAPISNAPFLQESQFLAVLPSDARHGAPGNLLAAPDVDNPVLMAAKQAATEYQSVLDLPIDVGNALRAVIADVRTDRTRQWTSVELIATPSELLSPSGTLVRGFVQAEVVQPVDGDFEVTIGLSTAAEGPFLPVAEGSHDGTDEGALIWDLGASTDALGLEPALALPLLWVDLEEAATLDDREGRRVDVVLAEDRVAPWRQWEVFADDTLAFSGELVLTDDETPRPGWAFVFHDPAIGGIASGRQFDAEGQEQRFDACWDGTGTLVFQAGPGESVRVGSEARCPF